jgi:hypothetical protein
LQEKTSINRPSVPHKESNSFFAFQKVLPILFRREQNHPQRHIKPSPDEPMVIPHQNLLRGGKDA